MYSLKASLLTVMTVKAFTLRSADGQTTSNQDHAGRDGITRVLCTEVDIKLSIILDKH
jgi:hypothetical protein